MTQRLHKHTTQLQTAPETCIKVLAIMQKITRILNKIRKKQSTTKAKFE